MIYIVKITNLSINKFNKIMIDLRSDTVTLPSKKMMENLMEACSLIQKEPWFDKLSATVMVQFLAEIAEADHRIDETEIQLLKNISNFFGVKSPRI